LTFYLRLPLPSNYLCLLTWFLVLAGVVTLATVAAAAVAVVIAVVVVAVVAVMTTVATIKFRLTLNKV
jgi:hypothetical protein